MDHSKLKTYAPQARRAFIAAVTDRAAFYGLTAKQIEPVTEQGDVAIIGGKAFPRSVAAKRNRLEERIARQGFEQVMEAMAYTWFNRLVAIRFMELHGYLDHGYRVLSHPEKQGAFEILEVCTEVELPGVDPNLVIELKLDGTKDEELYRLLLLEQCHALHQAMPFLFEAVEDETELLLPANLLHTDSLIRQLVESIYEGLWQEIEIIGWLYQFYISEKKDQVIGKVVKSEDIPAATQLFTPNWIVKYMVQNSLGAQWLATYPDSPLKGLMEYYIEPAEQTDEVKAQLAAITPSTLNPEELTLIDPACGSGHILVEAYDLFKAIYLERGYRQRDVAQLILEKNLFGLDIDGRAAQLTGFALMMKGRADDRRLFERGVKLNVMALVDSAGFDAERLAEGVKLADYGLQPSDLTELKRLFEHATTFGSLIQVPDGLAEKLLALKELSEATSQDLFVSDALKRLGPLVQHAELLAAQYDAVVANPPYMGGKYMNTLVKKFAKDHFPDAKSNLFACFIERGYTLANAAGHSAMVTMQSWMFLSSSQNMRERMLRERTIRTMVHMSNGVMGIAFGTAATIIRNLAVPGYVADYSYTSVDDLNTLGVPTEFPVHNKRLKRVGQEEFKKIPGSPLAYWLPVSIRELFIGVKCGDKVVAKQGLATCNNELFLRLWSEVALSNIGFGLTDGQAAAKSGLKWFPYNKGGDYRSWYGNSELVVNWQDEGRDIHKFSDLPLTYAGAPVRAKQFYFRSSVSWTDLTSRGLSARLYPVGHVFDVAGHSSFFETEEQQRFILCFLNTRLAEHLGAILNATFHFQVGDFKKLPYPDKVALAQTQRTAANAVSAAQQDWDAYERSWDFQSLPILTTASTDSSPSLESSYTTWITQNRETIAEMKRLEEENNRLFIDAYGLQDELTPDVPIEQITLTVNPAYRYGGKLTEEEQWTRFRQDTMEELVSYAIGCMMGRYSLNEPGLIYAHSGNEGFDHEIHKIYEKKKTECLSSGSCPSRETCLSNDSYFSSISCISWFGPDQDGIIPLTDTEWFDDDVAHRVIKFISVAWDAAYLEDNLTFLADNLSPKKNESSRETIRHYICDKFFKDHLQTYRNRPIYWLFSSGKQRAFQCLVYLHRYNEGTLSRMRTEYVIPLQGKIASRIEHLAGEITSASSTSHRRKQEKERDKLIKQQAELQTFDEKLRHYADQRISLDLDDGVKVNYGKFGDLLAEVKAVTGGKEE